MNADFDFFELKDFCKNYEKAKLILNVEDMKEEIFFHLNKDFNNDHEIVIRKGTFLSNRTLGIKADKSSYDLNRQLIEKLKKNIRGEAELIGI